MTLQLRVGIVGLGVMGMRHATALSSMDGVVFAGAADHGAPRTVLRRPVVSSLADLLAVGVDACVVATTPPDHAVTATALAEAGVPTLVEKPLAMNPGECAQISAAFTSAGVLGVVGHVERFHPAVLELQVALAEGHLGPVERVVTRREGGPPRRRFGDVLLDLGTHDFDLTRWLTGLSHEQLAAHSTDVASGTDAVEVVATLSGGAEATHRLSWCSPHRARAIEVHSAGGVLVADTADPGTDPPVPAQLRAFRDMVLGRLDPAEVHAVASLSAGTYAVEVAARAAQALNG